MKKRKITKIFTTVFILTFAFVANAVNVFYDDDAGGEIGYGKTLGPSRIMSDGFWIYAPETVEYNFSVDGKELIFRDHICGDFWGGVPSAGFGKFGDEYIDVNTEIRNSSTKFVEEYGTVPLSTGGSHGDFGWWIAGESKQLQMFEDGWAPYVERVVNGWAKSKGYNPPSGATVKVVSWQDFWGCPIKEVDDSCGKLSTNDGFSWEPAADGDEGVMVLLPSRLTGKTRTDTLRVLNSNGNRLELSQFSGIQESDNRESYKLKKSGRLFRDNVKVVVDLKDGQKEEWSVPNTAEPACEGLRKFTYEIPYYSTDLTSGINETIKSFYNFSSDDKIYGISENSIDSFNGKGEIDVDSIVDKIVNKILEESEESDSSAQENNVVNNTNADDQITLPQLISLLISLNLIDDDKLPLARAIAQGEDYENIQNQSSQTTPTTSQNNIANSSNTQSSYSNGYTRNLSIGSTGNDVKRLQQFLNNSGFFVSTAGAGSPGNESLYFGPATQSALARFQAANGIKPATGYFGPVTRNLIQNTIFIY